MEAIHSILQQDKPDDFVISTGESHSVREFAELAFSLVGLDSKKYIKIDKRFFRPLDVNYLNGDSSKAKETFDWKAKTTFEDLVKIMLDEDLKKWKMSLDGKTFPLDAPLYPDDLRVVSRQSKKDYNHHIKSEEKHG